MQNALSGQLLALMFALFVVLFALQARILVVLRRRYPEIHRAIPQPILVADGENENNMPAARFFWRFVVCGEYSALGDTELTFLCRAALAFSALFVLAFVVAFVGVFSGGLS